MNRSMLKVMQCAAISLMLSGCSVMEWFGPEEEDTLPGERVSVLELQKELEPDQVSVAAQGFVAPSAWTNEFWPQRGGYPNHAMQNLALKDKDLTELWSVSIGKGGSNKLPLQAQPIVVGGAVFTLDTDSRVTAFNVKTGEQGWKLNVRPKKEDESAIGGGLAFGQGLLFITSGYNNILAVDPKTGKPVWKKDLPAPSATAPTAFNDKVFVQTLDNQIFAYDAKSGAEAWRFSAIGSDAGLIGAASPAADKDLMVAVFSSGEILGIDVNTGAVRWSDTLATRRKLGNAASLTDVTALPVIDQDAVFGIGFGGRMTALSVDGGNRLWQREISGTETPWVAGNHIFLITTENKLIAVGRDTGTVRWVLDLALINPEEKGIYWTGPVLAGGRLLIASSEGQMAEITPDEGRLIGEFELKDSVSIPPVVANQVLYVLSDDGKLTAYK